MRQRRASVSAGNLNRGGNASSIARCTSFRSLAAESILKSALTFSAHLSALLQ